MTREVLFFLRKRFLIHSPNALNYRQFYIREFLRFRCDIRSRAFYHASAAPFSLGIGQVVETRRPFRRAFTRPKVRGNVFRAAAKFLRGGVVRRMALGSWRSASGNQ